MKRLIFVLIISILVMSFFTPISVSAATIVNAEPVIDNYISKNTFGLSEVFTVDSNAIAKLKRINSLSTGEKCTQLLSAFGLRVYPYSMKYKELVDQFDRIHSITVNVQYIKIDGTGRQTILSKDDCLNEVKIVENSSKPYERATTSSLSYHESSPKTSSNGYMRQIICSIYNSSPQGTYTIIGESLWLIAPLVRMTDAVSLSSTSVFTWSNANTDSYMFITQYDETYDWLNSGTSSTNTIQNINEGDPDGISSSSGVYYVWDLPETYATSVYRRSYSNLVCQIWATCRVTNYTNPNQVLNINLRYAHVQIAISGTVSFGWSVPGGVTLGGGIVFAFQRKYYDHYFSWDYYDEFN